MKVLITTLILFSSLLSFGQKKKQIKPIKSVAKVTLVGKREYAYNALSEKQQTTFEVTGPGVLYVNNRIRLENGEFKSTECIVKCLRSDDRVQIERVPSLMAGNLKLKNKKLSGSPTKKHVFEIEVPPGKHKYKFYKHKTDQKVYIRTFYKQYPSPVWKSVSSESNVEERKIRYTKSGKTQTYALLNKGSDAFDFSIKDKSQLRIVVRPQFNNKMLDNVQLKIGVLNEKTGKEQIYKMNSSRSRQTEFVNDKAHKPGSAKIIYVKLDKPVLDSDRYKIRLVSGPKAAVIRVTENQAKIL